MQKFIKYKIISLVRPHKNIGKARVRVQVCGTGRTFIKEAKELYSKSWIEDFSKEDAAYLGTLLGYETKMNAILIEQFPREKQHPIILTIFLSTFIIIFLIVANIGSIKIAYFNLGILGDYHFPSSVIFFPFVFLLTDISTELLGFSTCRKIIWFSFLGLAILLVTLQISIWLPSSYHWTNQSEYAFVLRQTPKIFIASSLAFLTGDLLNAYVLSKLRQLTSGRFFILRALGSTIIGAVTDSLVFVNIAYWGKYSFSIMINMIFTESIIKIIGEAILLPLAVLLIFILNKFVKKKYEFTSKLNPFSIPDEQEI